MRIAWIRQHLAALRALLVLTLLLGIAYPVATWAVGQVAFHDHANGSPVRSGGQVVGSRLVGQNFTGAQWFHSRPVADSKAIQADPYDPLNTGGSNLGPSNPDLVKRIKELKAQVAKENGVPESQVPPDAVTASGSGIDPDISPEYAKIQINRVAHARHLDAGTVRSLVERYTSGRQFGIFGQPHVNVLRLNQAVSTAK